MIAVKVERRPTVCPAALAQDRCSETGRPTANANSYSPIAYDYILETSGNRPLHMAAVCGKRRPHSTRQYSRLVIIELLRLDCIRKNMEHIPSTHQGGPDL